LTVLEQALDDIEDQAREYGPGDTPFFTCPRCRKKAYRPPDILKGYCVHCDDWTGGS
jgi:hypothetical protein